MALGSRWTALRIPPSGKVNQRSEASMAWSSPAAAQAKAAAEKAKDPMALEIRRIPWSNKVNERSEALMA